MARSVKKGPYIDESLIEKIGTLNAENKKVVSEIICVKGE